MSEELKPCPFCGGKAYVAHEESKILGVRVLYPSCLNIECTGFVVEPPVAWPTERQAIAAWNTRASPSPQPASEDPAGVIQEVISEEGVSRALVLIRAEQARDGKSPAHAISWLDCARALARHLTATQAPSAVREALEALEANLGTLVEQRRRCQRWEKSTVELDTAIEETRTVLAALSSPQDNEEGPRETLESLVQWGDETFGPCTAERALSRAMEEKTELDEELARPIQQHALIAIEAADMIICLLRVPGIVEAINTKMAINRKRIWKLMGDGTGYHVKDARASQPSSHDRKDGE